MVVLRLVNFYITSIRETLRAVNVMTARDFARIQKGGRGVHVLSTPSKIMLIIEFSIYTLSDLGDLSNLIGSLSRTIQQYSPPSEWIMCEHVFFPHFLRERSFKSRQNPRADFFSGKKRLRRIQNGVFPFTVVEFCGR